MYWPGKAFGKKIWNEIGEALSGNRPTPPEDTDWSEKRVPKEDEFNKRIDNVYANGLLCKVRLYVTGSNVYPHNPLIGLEVIPLETPVTNKPATHTGKWHISVAFHEHYNKDLERAFIEKYNTPQQLRLIFWNISRWNAVSELDVNNDPIASDPVVQALHQASHYRDRPLHITFKKKYNV